jgi:hypothetical protein
LFRNDRAVLLDLYSRLVFRGFSCARPRSALAHEGADRLKKTAARSPGTWQRAGIAGASALLGASDFFELAVATALALFGLNSGAALAMEVGMMIEVPAMASVVNIVLKSAVGATGIVAALATGG